MTGFRASHQAGPAPTDLLYIRHKAAFQGLSWPPQGQVSSRDTHSLQGQTLVSTWDGNYLPMSLLPGILLVGSLPPVTGPQSPPQQDAIILTPGMRLLTFLLGPETLRRFTSPSLANTTSSASDHSPGERGKEKDLPASSHQTPENCRSDSSAFVYAV